MGSKTLVLVGFLLAMVLLISSQVAASQLDETVHATKNLASGRYKYKEDAGTDALPKFGFPKPNLPPGFTIPKPKPKPKPKSPRGPKCLTGCCGRHVLGKCVECNDCCGRYYLGRCTQCCTYAGQKPDVQIQN